MFTWFTLSQHHESIGALIIEKARRAPLMRVRLDFRASMTRFEDPEGIR